MRMAHKLKNRDKYIYVPLFSEDDQPLPKQIYYLGSRYYHGILGDGINAMPTYSILQCLKYGADKTNFRTFYKLILGDEYGSDGQVIDIPNIIIEDWRFPPNDEEPTDPPDPWKPPFPEDEDEEDDYTTLVARSQAIMWSFVNSPYNV